MLLPAREGDFVPRERKRPSVADTSASRAVAVDEEIAGLSESEMEDRIRALRHQRKAVILAHNYERPEIQDLADFVGDSFQLSKQAAATDASVIVFCGVHFMAETAALLSPDKKVLIPDPEAGCSLAATASAEEVRQWKSQHPGAVVVAYINTTAEVKAEADLCCTSANAVRVVRSVPEDQEVLFLPDMYLGLYVQHVTGRLLSLWLGQCHVHEQFTTSDAHRALDHFADADLLLHPECGCVSNCMYEVASGALPRERTFVLSTGGMIRHAADCKAPVDLVGTEVGLLHRLRREHPGKSFVPLKEDAVCEYMKTITVPKLYRTLRDDVYQVTVPEPIASAARVPIQAMMALG